MTFAFFAFFAVKDVAVPARLECRPARAWVVPIPDSRFPIPERLDSRFPRVSIPESRA
jgi:hypothetical protein